MKKTLFLSLLFLSLTTLLNGHFIGKYNTPYNTLNPILSLKNPTISVIERMPDSLVLALAKEFGVEDTGNMITTREDLTAFLNSINVSFQIVFHGHPLEGEVDDRIFNIVFHNDIRDWFIGTPDFNPEHFGKDISMGLFAPKGVAVTDVPQAASVDALRAEAVSIHDAGVYYSPNNVRFRVEPERAISSFWGAAISPDKQNLVITFDLLINNPVVEEVVSGIMQNDELALQDKLVIVLETVSAMLTSPEDLQTLEEATLIAS